MNRASLKNLRWKARRVTAPLRPLPDFIIIGAQKGGTSALNYYLADQHPSVLPASRKEVHFYDRNFHRGLLWYRAHFPLLVRLAGGRTTGEASPYYLAHPHVPAHIAKTQPGVKLIALLRNPKTRAVSHYQFSVRRGREELPLKEALEREEERIADGWGRLLEDEGYDSTEYRFFSYKHRGRYAEQLRRYLQHFDRSQLLVLPSEALKTDTAATMERICAFLGIPPELDRLDLNPRGIGSYSRELPPEVEEHLDAYFRPLNRDLYELLGEDFGWT